MMVGVGGPLLLLTLTAARFGAPDTPGARSAARGPALDPAVPRVGKTCSVLAFGAVGDGVASDTAALRAAIEHCGTVRFPAGNFSTGTLMVPSDTVLALSRGAVLVGRPGEFAPPQPNPWSGFQDYGHSHWHDSLIVVDGVANVTVTGPGLLDGGPNMAENQPPAPGIGCRLLALRSARSVTLSGFSTASRTGWFALLATNVTGLHVTNTVWDVTRDGLDIVGCRDVVIEKTTVLGGGDDAIVLKSDWSLGAQLDSSNITVRDCTVGSWGNNALQIGSETVGDFTAIRWQRIRVLYAGQAGIGMVSMDGGRVHGVVYENITMAQTAIPISMYIGARQGRHPRPFHVGSISGITVRNVKDSDCFSDRHGPASWAATLDGQPADPRFNVTRDHAVGPGIHLENVDLSACYRGGGNASERTREPDHAKGEAYPAPGSLGPRPAYGLYVRHAVGVEIRDLSLGWWPGNASDPCCRPDQRAAVIVEASDKIVFDRLQARRDGGTAGPGYDVGLRKGARAGTTVISSPGIVVRNLSSSDSRVSSAVTLHIPA